MVVARLSADHLRAMADDAFTVLNYCRRQGLDRDQQIAELVRTFEVTLGYREPVKSPEDA